MPNEDTFNGAKGAFMVYQTLFNVLTEELGQERALALNVKANERTGTEIGRMIKEQTGVEEMDIKGATTLVRNAIEQSFGIVSEVTEESDNRVVFKLDRCPVHEAARDTGMDAETIEAQCRSGAVTYMSTMLKQLNPNLDYELVRCRATADEPCEEAITLK